jgi:hypothetical protein
MIAFMPGVFFISWNPSPLWVVLGLSVVVGFVMVFVFRHTSNQKAIQRAKDALKAHLLAVRLFQDQLPVVLRAYGSILHGTGTYLRLAFTPFLIAIVPVTFLIIQCDRYLGSMPLRPAQPFLVETRVSDPMMLDGVELRLPDTLLTSDAVVHIPQENTVVWRVVAGRDGAYDVHVLAGGQDAIKRVVVSSGLSRLSPVRLRGDFWERTFHSSESALPDTSPIQSIAVNYPERSIQFAWMSWNWIVLFFVVSLVAGFVF